MTYDTALNLFGVVAIPAIVFVAYKLFVISRHRGQDSSQDNPFVYEIDPVNGDIVFGDEKRPVNADLADFQPVLESKQDQIAATMVDVLSPEEALTDDAEQAAKEKRPEEA